MRLSVRSEYGVLALIDLAQHHGSGPVSARGVAERQDIPPKFLEQIFVAMRQAGLVTAVRGARGGFLLARDPAEITVLDAVEALEGPLQPTVCDGTADCARGAVCAAASVWGEASRTLRQVLGARTLADLAAEQAYLQSCATEEPAP